MCPPTEQALLEDEDVEVEAFPEVDVDFPDVDVDDFPEVELELDEVDEDDDEVDEDDEVDDDVEIFETEAPENPEAGPDSS